MSASSYSLRDPLPSEFVRRNSTGIVSYRNYPVFSWPWLWRRLLLFGLVSLLLSIFATLPIGLAVKDGAVTFEFWLRQVIGWPIVFGTGPCLATLVRYRSLPDKIKRAGLVAAIVVGLFAGYLEQHDYDEYMRTEVNLRPFADALGITLQSAKEASTDPGRASMHSFFKAAVKVSTIAIYFLVGGGVALLSYFRQQRRWRDHVREQELRQLRLQRDESDRRLTVLQAQVEPHFLFNTLASVRSLIKPDPRRAEATIDALVDHLRATLPKLRAHGSKRTATLSQQLEICRSYLEVMRVRMGERLSFNIDIPASLHDCAFPPLMLISLVENAIKHGVEPKTGPCSITIVARLTGNALAQRVAVTVLDDGAGLRLGLSDGVGLSNIRAQLQTCYGNRASLSLEQRSTGGVAAHLCVPHAATASPSAA